MTDWKDTLLFGTLAAAYAEAGDFDAAIEWQEKALGLLAKSDEQNRKDLDARLALYRAKKPYREESKAGSNPTKVRKAPRGRPSVRRPALRSLLFLNRSVCVPC